MPHTDDLVSVRIGLSGHSHGTQSSNTNPTAPSPVEAKYYYYGIYSRPRSVARSSADVWVEPTGAEAYLIPKEISPVGLHPLNDVWETMVGPAMDRYLQDMGVKCSSLDPIRMGQVGEPAPPPVIIWVGVLPGSLSADDGVQVAIRCKAILTDSSINDVHVEIRESEVTRCSTKMYKPVVTSNPIAQAIEPFATTLGLPICAEVTPNIQGTAGLFFTDPLQPGKLYLLTTRHVVFHPDNDPNELYEYRDTNMPRRNVLLMSDEAFEKYTKAIESEIGGKNVIIKQLERRLECTKEMAEEDAKTEREQVGPQLDQMKTAIDALKKILLDINRHWKKPEQRILGHIVLSPPIAFNVGDEGYTEDWAVIEVDPSKVDSTNFNGNAIDLGVSVPVDTFTDWMYANRANPGSFKYPPNRLLKFNGTVSDNEMSKLKSDLKSLEHDNDPCIMVIKRGCTSGLTVGRLNTIRSFVRVYHKGQPGQMSKEVAVLPRNSESGPFSGSGDSGSVVVDGKGRVAGVLTSYAGVSNISDCTYLTSINFLLKRLELHNVKANIFAIDIA